MFRCLVPLGLLLMTTVAAVAQEQALPATPITIDLAGTESANETILIAAYQPTPERAPRLVQSARAGQLAALRIDASLPRPSVILGRIEAGQEEAFGIEQLLPTTVAAVGFGYKDLAARAALRERDPALFRKLVEEGHVDPPETDLNAALQTELARMNCYRSRVDNAWGPGSRRSVGAYFDQAEEASWPDQEPSMGLFRTIVIQGDVTCPDPVASPTTAQTTTRRTTTTQPAPAPAARSGAPKIKLGAGLGSGVSR